MLIPVGGGILLRASPPKTDRVLLNIGANVVVEKTREDATKFMEARANELEDSIGAIASQRNQIAQRLDSDQQGAAIDVEQTGSVTALVREAQRGLLLSHQGSLREEALGEGPR